MLRQRIQMTQAVWCSRSVLLALCPICLTIGSEGAQARRHGLHIRQSGNRGQRAAEVGFLHLMGDHHDLGIVALTAGLELHDRADRHAFIAEAAADAANHTRLIARL